MFNTYVRREGDRTHIEQLPHDTADAARLYGECLEKARKEIAAASIEKFGVDNEVRVLTCATDVSIARLERRVRVIFSVNGRRYDFLASVDEGVRAEVIRSLAETIMEQAMRAMAPDLKFK